MGGAAERGRLRELVAGAVARGTVLSPRDVVALALHAVEVAGGRATGDLVVCRDGTLRPGAGGPAPGPAAALELAGLVSDLLAGRSGSRAQLPPAVPSSLRETLVRALGEQEKGRFPHAAALATALRTAVGTELAGEGELADLLVRLCEDGDRVTLGQVAVAKVPASAVQSAPPQQEEKQAKSAMRGRLLGEILLARGRLDEDERDRALQQQARFGGRLGEILVEDGRVTEGDVVRALSEQTGIPFVSEAKIASMPVPADLVARLPLEKAERLGALPLTLRGRELFCALVEPRDLAVLDELAFVAGVPAVRGVFATAGAIRRGLARFYRGEAHEQAASWEIPETPSPAVAATPWPAFAAPAPAVLPWVAAPQAEPVPVPAAQVGGSGVWEIPSALLVPEPDELPAALVLEEEVPPAVTRLREHLLGVLLERRAGVGALPTLVRRLAVRLGAPGSEVERAVAFAEAAVLLDTDAPFRCPAAARFEAALQGDATLGGDLLAAAHGAPPASAAAAAFAAGIAFVEVVGTAVPCAEAASPLLALRTDPRLLPEAILALAAEVAAAFPAEKARVLVAMEDARAAAQVVTALLAAGLPTLEVEEEVALRLALAEPLSAAVFGDLAGTPAIALETQLRTQPGLERLPVVLVGPVPAPEAAAAVVAALGGPPAAKFVG